MDLLLFKIFNDKQYRINFLFGIKIKKDAAIASFF